MNSILRSLGLVLLLVCAAAQVSAGECLSPDAIVASDKQLFVACDTGKQVLVSGLGGASDIENPFAVAGFGAGTFTGSVNLVCHLRRAGEQDLHDRHATAQDRWHNSRRAFGQGAGVESGRRDVVCVGSV